MLRRQGNQTSRPVRKARFKAQELRPCRTRPTGCIPKVLGLITEDWEDSLDHGVHYISPLTSVWLEASAATLGAPAIGRS